MAETPWSFGLSECKRIKVAFSSSEANRTSRKLSSYGKEMNANLKNKRNVIKVRNFISSYIGEHG